MDAKVYLINFSGKFESFSKRMFLAEIKKASKIDFVAKNSLQNIQQYMSGGKKVRPALTSLGFKLASKKESNSILPTAFAVELMHNGLLIHDDFVDNDATRRGRPTMHKVYLGKNGEHFAASMAIITADVGIFWANEIISNSSFDSKLVTKAIGLFNRHLLNTGYGELMDIDYDFRDKTEWRDILNIRIYKTAYYTFIMPLTVGAVLGGAGDTLLKDIEKFGYNVGLAFQLRDDVLGVFGDSGETGKSNESDILEGKKTLLYFKALELAGEADKKFLETYYGNIESPKQVEKIREIIMSTGALEYSESVAKDYIKKGKVFISNLTKDKDLQETLSTFSDYMIDRNK